MAYEKLIVCSNIFKKFGKVEIFDNMNITIESNQIIGLIGENGSGKTSFIKLISGMILPDQGNIYLFDKEIKCEKDIIALKDKISILGDANRSLYWNLSGMDNLIYFWTVKTGLNKKAGLMLINELVDKFNMGSFINKKVESYSKGMKQRLLLVVALLGHPKLLVMDEPLNGLDYENTVILKNYINEFVNKENGTVLLTSHNSRFIDEVCDTKFVIKNKRIEKISNVERGERVIVVYYKCLKNKDSCLNKYIREEREENIFRVETYINDKDFYKELSWQIDNGNIELLEII